MAEDFSEDKEKGVRLKGECEGYMEEDIVKVKEKFRHVLSDKPGKTDVCKLVIDTGDARLIALPPYRVPEKMKEGVKEEVRKMVESGTIIPTNSPWSAPIVPVPKPDESIRICIDFRRLNSVTKSDPYYMITLDEILERVGVISKLDLAKGYYQVEVEEGSIEKTAFITPFGKYACTRMPFWLKNAPAIFQRAMEYVLKDLYDLCAPYIDDIIVFSDCWDEYLVHLEQVFLALDKHGLKVKESKCEFGKMYVEYLDHIVGNGQLAVPEHRATAMKEYKQPVSKKDLRSFLVAMSYYRRFIPHFAEYSSVLSPATSKKASGVVQWSEEMLAAFSSLTDILCNVCKLTIPVYSDVFSLHTDASGAGLGATLNVVRQNDELPVAFYGKQLQGAQKRYSATELECLAIYKAINHFAHFLHGRSFCVYTDHKALVSLLQSRVLNRRLQGWVLQLQDFDFQVIYKPGKDNADVDALSRQSWPQTDIEEQDADRDREAGCPAN